MLNMLDNLETMHCYYDRILKYLPTQNKHYTHNSIMNVNLYTLDKKLEDYYFWIVHFHEQNMRKHFALKNGFLIVVLP